MLIGDIDIHPIADGTFRASPAYFGAHARADGHEDLFTRHAMAWLPIGCFLVRTGDRTILVDAGMGPEMRDDGPRRLLVGGQLLLGLRAVGVTPPECGGHVQVLDYVGGTLVIPQSVLVEQYWDELESGLRKAGIPVHHFVLHADHDTLVQRIENDAVETGARQWRLDHLVDYQQAQPWLSRRARLIDTTKRTPSEVAALISGTVPQSADEFR
ncbi:hypothetical protein [Streptomyces sp. RPT161]|uniref:hypothetical protein n=1 Tax=Streptomyces sp. RPT161 TaxID=3015993 RepID=UPI0022B8719E|nr:hypothetical protein [Streptomyces sp. RPT161]